MFCSDIKIVKKTPKKVMSDLSQIYNRPKKVKKVISSNTATGVGAKLIPPTALSKELKVPDVG